MLTSSKTKQRTPNVKVIREGQHGIDGGKSNPRASAGGQAAWLDVVEVYSDTGISGAKG